MSIKIWFYYIYATPMGKNVEAFGSQKILGEVLVGAWTDEFTGAPVSH